MRVALRHIGALLRAAIVLGLVAAAVSGPLPVAADEAVCPIVADNWIDSTSQNENHGLEPILRLRPLSAGKSSRALLLPALDSVPAGATIASATLSVYLEVATKDHTISLYRLTESWTENGSTWVSRDGVSSWLTPGGTFSGTPLGTVSAESVGWLTFDVTSTVQEWVQGTQANHGLILVSDAPRGNASLPLTSREGVPAQQPSLRVVYAVATPTPTLTQTPTATPTATETPTVAPTATATPTSTPTPVPNHPVVETAALHSPDRLNAVSAMDPQREYAVKVTVTDLDTLANLKSVTVVVFLDADGDDDPADVPLAGEPQTAARLTWIAGEPSSWSLEPAGATTWELIADHSAQPDLSGTTGDFWFHFRPGKVAAQSLDWDIYAVADDGGGLPGSRYDGSDYAMNWYGEISISTAFVDWGPVRLGSDFPENQQSGIAVWYISNGYHVRQIRSDGAWSSSGTPILLNTAGSPGDGEFSLLADDTPSLPDAVLISTEYATFGDGYQTSESGALADANTLWLKLGPATIPVATYSGTLYYRIAP